MLHKLRRAVSAFRSGEPDQTTFDTVANILNERANAIDQAIPRVELAPRHISNLEVVVDRNAFLELMPKDSVVAELGVAEGEFSAQILARTTPRELHLVDSWTHDYRYANIQDQVAARFAPQIAAGQFVLHQGLSTTELAKFPDAYFDWLYLDTSHDYQSTAEELELCRQKVKPGGLIAGHDYVTGYWLGRDRYGVIEAVNGFCVKYDWELIYLTHESHRHLSFAIRPLPSEPSAASKESS